MKVHEMINQLSRYNPNADVVCWDEDCDEIAIVGLDTSEDTDDVRLDVGVIIRLHC